MEGSMPEKWFLTTCVVLFIAAGAINGLRCRTDEDSTNEEDYREAVRVCMSNVSNDWEYAATNEERGGSGGRRQEQRRNYNRGHSYYGGMGGGEDDDRGGRRGANAGYGGSYAAGAYGSNYGNPYGGSYGSTYGGAGSGFGAGTYGGYGGYGGGRRGPYGSMGGPVYHSNDGDEYGDSDRRGGNYGSNGGGVCEIGGSSSGSSSSGSGSGSGSGSHSSNSGGGNGNGGGMTSSGSQQGQRKNNRGNRPRPRTRRASAGGVGGRGSGAGPGHGPGSDRRFGQRGSKSMLDQVDPCIVHCIFRQMKMVSENSRPEKGAVLAVMTQRVRDPELKDFIQESIDECFDILHSDNRGGKCDFSKNLALCLEEKGRRHCDDWDDEMGGKGSSSNSSQRPRQHYVRGR